MKRARRIKAISKREQVAIIESLDRASIGLVLFGTVVKNKNDVRLGRQLAGLVEELREGKL